jgi:hypothetical protein
LTTAIVTAPNQGCQSGPQCSVGLGHPHVFLIGRPPLSEYLGFIAANAVDGAAADQGALANTWRQANDHIRELEVEEAGWADSPAVLPLPGDVHALRDRLLGDPMVQRTFALFPVEIGMVELERMVVFQKQINVAYAANLRAAFGDDPTPEDLFRFCLPIGERRDPPVRGQRIAQNAWAFVSPSNDFRLLDAIDDRGHLGPRRPRRVRGDLGRPVVEAARRSA